MTSGLGLASFDWSDSALSVGLVFVMTVTVMAMVMVLTHEGPTSEPHGAGDLRKVFTFINICRGCIWYSWVRSMACMLLPACE